jgi:hypothetical protein
MTRKRFFTAIGGVTTAFVIVAMTMGGGVASGAGLTQGAIVGHISVAPAVHVNASHLPTGFHSSGHVQPVLYRNGSPILKSAPSTGAKPGATASKTARTPLTTLTNAFNGIDLGTSNCGCQPPDVNAAVGNGYIVETTNLELAVYNESGGLITSFSLNNFIGSNDSLSDPRVVYDPTWNRWAISFLDENTASLWLIYSQSGDPTAGWWYYNVGWLPAGSITDYPNVGMDQNSFAYTTNNFNASNSYINTTSFDVPKARVYNGYGWSVPLGGVNYNTTPAIVGGHPTQIVGGLYMLSPDDAGNQMLVYVWTNTGGTPALTYKGAIPYNWAAPPRRVNQPGTATTLDPLDGRIAWSATQIDGRVWFAHGAAVGSFPGVNYGYVQTNTMTISTGTAYRTSSSDDFNPAISVQDAPNGTPQEWLTWAYTDTPNNIATRVVYALNVGTTLPHLAGSWSGAGGNSTGETRFGDYASSVPEYNAVGNCAEGWNAMVAQEFFKPNGDWATQIVRLHRPDQCTP